MSPAARTVKDCAASTRGRGQARERDERDARRRTRRRQNRTPIRKVAPASGCVQRERQGEEDMVGVETETGRGAKLVGPPFSHTEPASRKSAAPWRRYSSD